MDAVVIGNVTLDETFLVPALPRPGETLLAEACTRDLGGKGANQAVVLARAGIATRLVARIGHDPDGAALSARLATEGLDPAGLIATDLPTDRSVILLSADGENSIVSTTSCARAMDEADVSAALQDAAEGDILLMQGNLRVPVTRHGLTVARGREMATVFTPAPVQPGFPALWSLVDLAVLNRAEAEQLTGSTEPEEACRRLGAAGVRRAVVTLGGAGAVMAEGARIHAAPAAPATVRDTTGAGDTFCAVLAAALFTHRLPPPAALGCAARAAAVTVSRRGTLAAFPSASCLRSILAAP
jgi:ribokinase